MSTKIFIGTSGYMYNHWKEIFYPPNLTPRKWLEFYSQHFNCVELNVTFYRLPKRETFESWRKRTPEDFKFVIKGPRIITHIKRLKKVEIEIDRFLETISPLQSKIICILWQLPPSLKYNLSLLKDFVVLTKKKEKRYLQSIEFRNESWFIEPVYEILREHNINLCIADSPRFPYIETFTSNFLYLRFHGKKTLYGSLYSEKELQEWSRKIKMWLKNMGKCMIFFNNDFKGFAVKNALTLKKYLGSL